VPHGDGSDPVLGLYIDHERFLHSQSLCGGSPSSLSLAAIAAIPRSASVRVRLGFKCI
jgi:hypothetical protein